MSNQVSNIRNPLNIPDILANVFGYLPTACLAKLTYVNKMWRLEARHKLYQNRSKIIYRLLKKSLKRVKKFGVAFGLDMKVEFFTIRGQFQEQYKTTLIKSSENIRACIEADRIFYMDTANIDKYVNCRNLQRNQTGLDEKKFYAYKKLVNFESFLLQIGYIKDSDEVDHILDKCEALREWELERAYAKICN